MNIKFLLIFILTSVASCNSSNNDENPISAGVFSVNDEENLQKYWNDGKAEITSYKIEQARYGELRTGEAVTIFVTEPFSPRSMTKADQPNGENVPVMKCNFIKRFNTGIYPYSLMTSTFFPMKNGENSMKASHSMQEWCGHVYMELDNLSKPKLNISTYFQGENAQLELSTKILEDDFWTKIRLDPNGIKQGTYMVIPSFTFLRFSHLEPKGYKCVVSIDESNGRTFSLILNYPEIERKLKINYDAEAAHMIFGWTESYYSGFGRDRKYLESTGKRIKSIRTDYWNKHDNSHESMRKELGLSL